MKCNHYIKKAPDAIIVARGVVQQSYTLTTFGSDPLKLSTLSPPSSLQLLLRSSIIPSAITNSGYKKF